jgi:hypothetical protein
MTAIHLVHGSLPVLLPRNGKRDAGHTVTFNVRSPTDSDLTTVVEGTQATDLPPGAVFTVNRHTWDVPVDPQAQNVGINIIAVSGRAKPRTSK